jgi:hypothetical protein
MASMSSNYLAVLQLGNVLREMALVLPQNQVECLSNACKAYQTVTAQRCEPSLHAQAYERYVLLLLLQQRMVGQFDADSYDLMLQQPGTSLFRPLKVPSRQ